MSSQGFLWESGQGHVPFFKREMADYKVYLPLCPTIDGFNNYQFYLFHLRTIYEENSY